MITKDMKILCICRGGQVRSVAARHLLADRYGFRKVIACGWEKNDEETVSTLCNWADAILVVGSASTWKLNTPTNKTHLLDIGVDRWGHYGHQDLLSILTPLVERLLTQEPTGGVQ